MTGIHRRKEIPVKVLADVAPGFVIADASQLWISEPFREAPRRKISGNPRCPPVETDADARYISEQFQPQILRQIGAVEPSTVKSSLHLSLIHI